jgi:HSP20 family protein
LLIGVSDLSWEEFPSWFKRRRRFPFFSGSYPEEMDNWIREMDRWLEEALKEFSGRAPETLVRKKKLEDGTTVREIGPLVYGYSVTIGPDGRPMVREFGNMKPGFPSKGFGRLGVNVQERREPLVDIISENQTVKVIVEIPGVNKNDINLNATSNTLVIDVSTLARKYYKEIELPCEIDPQSARSTYNNGILETIFKTVGKGPKGAHISVE